MDTTAFRPCRTQMRGARGNALRALACAAALASVTLLTVGPAHAGIETPQDSPNRAQVDASPTRLAGLYGVHVKGGWLLR